MNARSLLAFLRFYFFSLLITINAGVALNAEKKSSSVNERIKINTKDSISSSTKSPRILQSVFFESQHASTTPTIAPVVSSYSSVITSLSDSPSSSNAYVPSLSLSPSKPVNSDQLTQPIMSITDQKSYQIIKIPHVVIQMFTHFTTMGNDTILAATGHHMTNVFQNETPQEIDFENLSLYFSSRRLQSSDKEIKESFFVFDGDAMFTSDSGRVDDSVVKEITQNSFRGDNLNDYINLLIATGVNVMNISASFYDTINAKPGGSSEPSDHVRLIASLSICGAFIAFFSIIIVYHSRHSCGNKIDPHPVAMNKRPVKYVDCGKGKEPIKMSWRNLLMKTNSESKKERSEMDINTMEMDEVSAISVDSVLRSSGNSTTWEISNSLEMHDKEDNHCEELETDLELQPPQPRNKTMLTGSFADIDMNLPVTF